MHTHTQRLTEKGLGKIRPTDVVSSNEAIKKCGEVLEVNMKNSDFPRRNRCYSLPGASYCEEEV